MKAFPLSALLYLLFRREWRAAGVTVAGLVVVLLIIPAPIRGLERNAHELALWYRGMLADQSGNSIGQRTETGFTYKNQSPIAVMHRLTRPLEAGVRAGVPFQVNFLTLHPRVSQSLGYLVILALGSFFFYRLKPRHLRSLESRRSEEAMVLMMVVFCSPLAWTYFYCWTLPSWYVLARFLTDPGRMIKDQRLAWRYGVFAGGVMATALSQSLDQSAQALGATFWGSVGIFWLMGWIMTRPELLIEGYQAPKNKSGEQRAATIHRFDSQEQSNVGSAQATRQHSS